MNAHQRRKARRKPQARYFVRLTEPSPRDRLKALQREMNQLATNHAAFFAGFAETMPSDNRTGKSIGALLHAARMGFGWVTFAPKSLRTEDFATLCDGQHIRA